MKRLVASSLFAAVMAGTLSLPALAAFDPAQLDKLHAGGVVIREQKLSNLDAFAGSVRVDAKPSEALDMVCDHKHYADFMPGLSSCEVKATNGSETTLVITGDNGELIEKWKRDSDRVVLDLVSASNFNDLAGEWRVQPDGDGTIITYALGVKTKAPIPGFIVNMKLRADVEAVMANVKKRINSKGKWTK